MDCPALIKGYHTDGIDVKLSARKTRPKNLGISAVAGKNIFFSIILSKTKSAKGILGYSSAERGISAGELANLLVSRLYFLHDTAIPVGQKKGWTRS